MFSVVFESATPAFRRSQNTFKTTVNILVHANTNYGERYSLNSCYYLALGLWTTLSSRDHHQLVEVFESFLFDLCKNSYFFALGLLLRNSLKLQFILSLILQ